MKKENTLTLRDLLYHAAEEYGEKPYLRTREKKAVCDISFAQFRRHCDAAGAFMEEKNGGETAHIAVTGLTSPAYLTTLFGAQASGNVIVPLDVQLSPDDLCDCINRADVTMFFYDSKLAALVGAVRQLCPQVKTIVQIDGPVSADGVESLDDILTEYDGKAPKKGPEAEDLAAIIYTSGTTGKSKGVMLTHANLIDNCFCEENESKVGDVLLSVLPIHHVYCLSCDIFLSLRYGTIIAINDSLMHLGRNIAFFQPNKMLLVPMIIQSLLLKIKAACKENPEVDERAVAKQALGGKLDIIYSGGAYLSPAVIEEFEKLGVRIAQGYGMTECSPRISTAHEDVENVRESVGKIVNGCQVRIVDGEIQAKSNSVMKGYYKNPEATAESLTEDGWLRTGDLGHQSEDGWLFITGRKKNLIILDNGENVSPEELENKFADNLLVAEVLVYAVDGVITAEIFPNEEYAQQAGVTDIKAQLQADIDEINLTVNSSKTIRKLVVRETEFEKTTSKKIKRGQVEK